MTSFQADIVLASMVAGRALLGDERNFLDLANSSVFYALGAEPEPA